MRAVASPDKGCAPGAVRTRRPMHTTTPDLRTVTHRVRTGSVVRCREHRGAHRYGRAGVHDIVGARTGCARCCSSCAPRDCTTSWARRTVRIAERVRALDAGAPRTHRWRRRRSRADRHGFGRPPGYCRVQRRRFGGGYSAARSRTALVSCFRRARCAGESSGGIGSTMRASVLMSRSPHSRPSPSAPGPDRRSRPGYWLGDFVSCPAGRSRAVGSAHRRGTHGRPRGSGPWASVCTAAVRPAASS